MSDHRGAGWDLTPAEARELQRSLAERVRQEPLDLTQIRTVAGADLSSNRGSDRIYAGIVVLSYPELDLIDRAGLESHVGFPYIPGLLSFRETPPLLEAWKSLRVRPDALIYDGHGLAHPRRFGIACHLGVLLDCPTVGCAKSVLVGRAGPLGDRRGSEAPLVDRDEVVGTALRTRSDVAPVYVSIGHRCTLVDATALVLACSPGSRLPETTRQAHAFVNDLRRAAGTAAPAP